MNQVTADQRDRGILRVSSGASFSRSRGDRWGLGYSHRPALAAGRQSSQSVVAIY